MPEIKSKEHRFDEVDANLAFIRWELTQDQLFTELRRIESIHNQKSREANDAIVDRRNREGVSIRVHNLLKK